MTQKAILFGAIGTLAETSELQRQSYNSAFAAHDLDWVWEPESYYKMLEHPGGQDRIARYARDAGDSVDAAAIHRTKEQVFAALVDQSGLVPREGVVETFDAARQRGVPMAFCTTTSPLQVGLVLDGLAPSVTRGDFEWVGDRTMVERGKPAPDIYRAALAALGLDPEGVLVIEDTPESAESALAAGLAVIGFPGRAARGRAFPAEVPVVDRLGAHIVMGDLQVAAE